MGTHGGLGHSEIGDLLIWNLKTILFNLPMVMEKFEDYLRGGMIAFVSHFANDYLLGSDREESLPENITGHEA